MGFWEKIINFLTGILEGIQGIFDLLKDMTEGVAIVVEKLSGFGNEVQQALSVFPAEIIAAVGALIALLVTLAALRWSSGG